MNVTLLLRFTCHMCGCGLRGHRFSNARVNKKSLRTTGTDLVLINRSCPECGADPSSPYSSFAYRASLDPESAERVKAYRQRKGWQ